MAPVVEGGPRVRIVQPAIDQFQKWTRSRVRPRSSHWSISRKRKTDSETLGAMSFSLIVWPETAHALLSHRGARGPVASRCHGSPGHGARTPAHRGSNRPATAGATTTRSTWWATAAEFSTPTTRSTSSPSASTCRWNTLLSRLGLSQWLTAWAAFGRTGAAHDRAARRPPVGRFPGLLRDHFPGRASDPRERPGFLVNLTNDAWFGRTPDPGSIDLARMRAIEEGLPVVRAANSGGIRHNRCLWTDPRTARPRRPRSPGRVLARCLATNDLFDVGGLFLLTVTVFSVTLLVAGGRRSARIHS